MAVATPQSQGHKSLRVYVELTPPSAFDKADAQSYVAFQDPTIDPLEDNPYTGRPNGVVLTKSQGMAIAVQGGDVEWSHDGVTVHGKLLSSDPLLNRQGVREAEVYFRSVAGSPTVRLVVW